VATIISLGQDYTIWYSASMSSTSVPKDHLERSTRGRLRCICGDRHGYVIFQNLLGTTEDCVYDDASSSIIGLFKLVELSGCGLYLCVLLEAQDVPTADDTEALCAEAMNRDGIEAERKRESGSMVCIYILKEHRVLIWRWLGILHYAVLDAAYSAGMTVIPPIPPRPLIDVTTLRLD